MIETDTSFSHVVTVEFNAWRFEREDHPLVPLVATIEKAVAAKATTPDKEGLNMPGDQVAWYKEVGIQCRAFLAGWQFKLKPDLYIPMVGKIGAEATWSAKDSLQRYSEITEELSNLEDKHWSALRNSCLSLSVFDVLDKFRKAESDPSTSTVTKSPLVIVFIDDLDRCQAEKAFELLESIKLVLCQPGFVFVLALNHVVVDAYLSHLAQLRYGKDNSKLHRSYLEKIVQLPLAIPSRHERFADLAQHLLETRLDPNVDPAMREGLKALSKVLARSSNRTPRSLVRRINTTLIDIALRDPVVLPPSLKDEKSPFPYFSGLCIVQRALEAALGQETTNTLAEDNFLCGLIAKNNIWGISSTIKEKQDGSASAMGGEDRNERAKALWSKILDAIWSDPANNFLWKEDQDASGAEIAETSVLTSSEGKRWLTEHAERRAIMRITVQRPVADAATMTQNFANVLKQTVDPNQGNSSTSLVPPMLNNALTERDVVEKAIRKHLQLPSDAPLGNTDYARVTELDFSREKITDSGMAWLADLANSLTGLTNLDLGLTAVTDSCVKYLELLTNLKNLSLNETNFTDAGLKNLAKLTRLTHLYLRKTAITDDGLSSLKQLNELKWLNLYDCNISDKGVRSLESLSRIEVLGLGNTKVSDQSLAHISGLKNMTKLSLENTAITNACIDTLATFDRLELLGLGATSVDDRIITKLLMLRNLKKLYVDRTRMSASGVKELRKKLINCEIIS